MRLPKRLEDLTLKQYIEIQAIDANVYDERYKASVSKLCVLSGKPAEYFEALTFKSLYKLIARIAYLNTPPEHIALKPYLWIGFKKYKATVDLNTMSPGQMIDFLNLSKSNAPLNERLAVMFTRGKYNPENHGYISKKLLNAKVGDCLGLLFFYINFLNKCAPIIAQFSERNNSEIQMIMNEIATDKEFQYFLNTGGGNTM